VTFMAKCYQTDSDGLNDLVSYFVMVDCAGSEGESAFTKDFIESVDKTTLMARRLEAGCINTGLSQLQIIFNELRFKGSLSKMKGNGLRRVLHPYINTKTFMAVLFTFSPSVNNSKPTESTLKFAVTAGMVKVKPVKAELTLNVEKLVQQLRKIIADNDKLIDEQNDKIAELNVTLEKTKQEGIQDHNLSIEDLEEEDEDEDEQEGFDVSAAFGGGKKKKKKGRRGKNQSTLPQDLLDRLEQLDAEEEEEYEEVNDSEWIVSEKGLTEADIDKEMDAALKRMNVQSGDMIKNAVSLAASGSDEEKTQDALEQLAETLDNAAKDVLDIQEEEEAKELERAAQAEYGANLNQMSEGELKEHVEETWDNIEDKRKDQKTLQDQQKKVVSHLLETNEWLFGCLNEVLTTS